VKLRWSLEARVDLLEIGDFIAPDSPTAARIFLDALRRRARQAAAHPLSGRMVPELNDAALRELIHGNYRIIYSVRGSTVIVLVVREAHRRLPADLAPQRDET
jgi:plasmid stabilization system protein ParE